MRPVAIYGWDIPARFVSFSSSSSSRWGFFDFITPFLHLIVPFFGRASPDLYPPHVISPILRASSDSSSFLCCSESLNRAFRSCQPSSSSSFSVFSSAASFRPALLLFCASLTVLKCQDRLGVITLPPSRSLSTSV